MARDAVDMRENLSARIMRSSRAVARLHADQEVGGGKPGGAHNTVKEKIEIVKIQKPNKEV